MNHRENFVNPNDTNVHTQTIEGFWSQSKMKLKAMKGVRCERLEAYLDEIMFHWNYKHEAMFMKLINIMAHYYPASHLGAPPTLGVPPPIVYP